MPMTAAGMKAKVEAAYLARTGQAMEAGLFNVLIDLCTGIVLEIQQNAKVTAGIPVSTTGGPTAQTGSTTAEGVIT
jgi:hypothetical protein